MSVEDLEFVEWREESVSQERGSRVVHYYLEDSSGNSHLAVVGTERSLRHMLYVISDDFARLIGSDSDGTGSSVMKWRSRREVVDWLASFLPMQGYQQEYYPNSMKVPYPIKFMAGLKDDGNNLCRKMGHKLKGFHQDISWSGVYWTCSKLLKHYHAFHRNGTTIASHSFVLVMSEDEENCYLAYLEDMYEDKKGQKKVKVRWFHRHQEVVGEIPPPTPHPKEVFITPYSQVISAECVDDLATILTPEHYEKFLPVIPNGVYICCRQYNKNKFKYFDISTLLGYFDQTILSSLDIYHNSGDEEEEEEEEEELQEDRNVKYAYKRIRSFRGPDEVATSLLAMRSSRYKGQVSIFHPVYQNSRFRLTGRKQVENKFASSELEYTPSFQVKDEIEVLCQDSGIRGCWFRCSVLDMSVGRLKVRYNDVQDEDGNRNLEEWVLAFRLAVQDRLGMRCTGRLTVRPCRVTDCVSEVVFLEIGTPVDAWWNDGWWEGVVIGVDSFKDDDVQVYFPGEDLTLNCQRKSLRISKDWIEDQWVDIDSKPYVLSVISALNPVTKLLPSATINMHSNSGGSEISGQKNDLKLERADDMIDGSSQPPQDDELEKSRKRSRDEEMKQGQEVGMVMAAE